MKALERSNGEELCDGQLLEIYKMHYIRRWNTQRTINTESVASHSFFTALFALELAHKFELTTEQTLEALTIALIHDIPEIATNDVTHDAKERMPELKKILEKNENKFLLDSYPEYAEIFFNKSSVSSEIVKVADKLSAYLFALNEVELGNNSFNGIVDDLDEQCREMITELEESLDA